MLEEIFCQLFSACEHAHDVTRADQWIRVGEAIAARRNLPAVSAFCRTHYGGVLTAAGRWPEADVALTEAVRLWGLGHRSLRSGALVRLADLRVRQGRFEEAEQLLDGLDAARRGGPPAGRHPPGARARRPAADDVLERALDQVDPQSTAAAPLLALLVDVHLAAGQTDAGRAPRPTQLVGVRRASPERLPRRGRRAGRGAGLPGRRHRRPAGVPPRRARRLRQGPDADGAGRTRGSSWPTPCSTEQPEVAMAEARAALEAFERLQAARHADAAAAVLRSLGVRADDRPGDGGGLLTKREAEVLDLLGHGLSNPEIADRLYISRKTVEHHVGNVLAKLGLRSRAEAAAYATRAKPGAE